VYSGRGKGEEGKKLWDRIGSFYNSRSAKIDGILSAKIAGIPTPPPPPGGVLTLQWKKNSGTLSAFALPARI